MRHQLKILHIGNPCGVAEIIGREMDKQFKTETTVVENADNDPYHQTTRGARIRGKWWFLTYAALEVLNMDIIHIHSHDKLAHKTHTLQPTVLHYHGSDIRGKWQKRHKYWGPVDSILVSTPDLLEGAPERARHFPNPVDTERFKPNGVTPNPGAITISYGANEEARRLAEKHGLKLTVIQPPIPWDMMPDLLRDYTHYIGVKRKNGVLFPGTRSVTAYEALACGLKVIGPDEVLEGLPEENTPQAAAHRLIDIYKETIG